MYISSCMHTTGTWHAGSDAAPSLLWAGLMSLGDLLCLPDVLLQIKVLLMPTLRAMINTIDERDGGEDRAVMNRM